MKNLILNSGWESMIFVMVLFGILVPIFLFIFGISKYSKDKKQGKIVLIIAAVYTIISFGVCGGFSI
jgi:hypothetical protein